LPSLSRQLHHYQDYHHVANYVTITSYHYVTITYHYPTITYHLPYHHFTYCYH
jgi:hypothetical protein